MTLTPPTSHDGDGCTFEDATPPVAGYVGLWDASDEASLTVTAGLVNAIADRSGSALTATAEVAGTTSGASVVPHLPASTGARPAIHSGSGVLSYTCGLSASLRTQTLFWAGVVRDFSAIRALFGANGNGGRMFRVTTAGRLDCTKRNVSTLATSSAAMAVTANAPFVAALVLEPAAITLYLDQVPAESFAEATTFTAALTSHVCGGDAGVAQRLPGILYEAIAYNAALSAGDVASVIAYLASKWDI